MFSAVDGDKGVDLKQKYEIKAYPSFIFIKQGKKVDTLRGATE